MQAWEHFWENVKPAIWESLNKSQKNKLIVADRDTRGLRTDSRNKEKKLKLGPIRIERLLNEFAPNKYRFVHHTDVYLNEPDE